MSDAARVAVCSRSFSRHPALRARLTATFPDVRFNETGARLTGDALVAFLQGAERAIVALEPVDGAILDRLPDLRVISKYGVGLDGLDLDALAARNIRLGWTGGVNRRAVAELVISWSITLLRHLPDAYATVRQGGWSAPVGRELGSVRFGVIGCGYVGKEVVRLLRPFGTTLLAHDLRDQPEFYAEHGVTPVDLPTLLATCDVVSLHVPLDASTRGLIGARELDRMAPGSVLINTARGGIVDEDALYGRLESGHLGGAAFDVLRDEPPERCPLLTLERFLCTPHIAGTTAEAIERMGDAAIAGLTHHRTIEEHRRAWAG